MLHHETMANVYSVSSILAQVNKAGYSGKLVADLLEEIKNETKGTSTH